MEIGELQFLIADKDEFQRRWLSIMLTNLGVRTIHEVGDGRSALALLQDPAHKIDITFIDLNLNDMDCMELIHQLAAHKLDTSVILISALDSSVMYSVAAMARACGIELLGTIDKPVAPEPLQAHFKQYRSPQDRSQLRKPDVELTETDLKNAIERHEFEPLFQPKVALTTGLVRGVEAFARWRHPRHGWVMPAVFIPALERSGLMDGLTWIMLEKSIFAYKRWRELQYKIPVSLNLSPSTLTQPGFSEKLAEFVASHKVEPNAIIIEVTESATASNVPAFLENLARLRMHGFDLSVDDFGTGQASMQQLMRIPFSELKLDRSFVAGASQNHAMEMVLSSSLELCRKLKRQSVAVGVETRQDWDFLLKLGCNYAQGFYIARPMDGAAIPAWMEEWSQFF
jgi:EAL domain-containing protein (putative c-di-GMP-specific phosphodiesterase class I)/AmiR/NasT family two-component response regulator